MCEMGLIPSPEMDIQYLNSEKYKVPQSAYYSIWHKTYAQ